MPLVLQFCYRFSSCVKERLKSSTKCGFIYFTSDCHYYTKEEGHLSAKGLVIKYGGGGGRNRGWVINFQADEKGWVA